MRLEAAATTARDQEGALLLLNHLRPFHGNVSSQCGWLAIKRVCGCSGNTWRTRTIRRIGNPQQWMGEEKRTGFWSTTTTRAAGSRSGGRRSRHRVVSAVDHLTVFSHEPGSLSRGDCSDAIKFPPLRGQRLTGYRPAGMIERSRGGFGFPSHTAGSKTMIDRHPSRACCCPLPISADGHTRAHAAKLQI
jgi:hypothetical protein